jgi:serine/threonine protein kinase/formylglycine-generating enzyme required for sulfatase activity
MTEEQVFLAALDLPNTSDRNAYLDEVCGDNTSLRRQVEALLVAHLKSGEFLNTPAPEQAGMDTHPSGAATIQTSDISETVDFTEEPERLSFLGPPTRPGSLGRLEHYEALQILGRGAFGIVLRAFDEVLQRVVAIKVMAPQLAATSPARKRFLREARSSAQVRHENVVQVYDVKEKPLPFLVMEYIPGETLQDRLDRIGPLEVSEVLQIGRQIAEGLAAAHARDLIHRDIKPGNVLLEGDQHKVKITDFGLARAADDASMTQSGMIAGTPLYMAPEQALGHTLDQRADLFSLGSVLYQMVTGRPPFRANSTIAVLKRVVDDTPRDMREVIPETPAWLCDIIAKLHAKDPDDRYQSAREVAEVLADCEEQLKLNSRLRDYSRIPKQQTVSPAPMQGSPTATRGRVATATAVLILLPLVALAISEFTGITTFFRGNTVTSVPVEPSIGTTPVASDQSSPETDGWVQLFNGQDLSGWKFHPDHPGHWEVKNGILRGSKRQSHLFTERGDYKNFHLRAEVKINQGGDSGIVFRAPLELRPGRTPTEFGIPGCYEAELQHNRIPARPTGSISEAPGDAPPTILGRALDGSMSEPDEWFTYEVIAEDNHFITKVNGVEAANCHDPVSRHEAGHIALQVWQANTLVQFRKIEIKELPEEASTLPSTFTSSLGMEFVLVPKGKSWLGGGKDKLGDQEVEIPADYYLGKYEVTQGEWERVMGANPSWFSRNGGGASAVKDISDADLQRFPVESVSWDDCQKFVANLNSLAKEPNWVYRLPTEVEWEYACRGGPMVSQADSAFDYCFGRRTNTLLSEHANFGAKSERQGTCEVGAYKANRLGLFDMHGNVLEFCDNAEKDDGGTLHYPVRGGNWTSGSHICRAGWRHLQNPSDRNELMGLRLARVPAGASEPKTQAPLGVVPFSPVDVQQVAALPAAQQVEEVRRELMQLNPGFDGKVTPTIENGVVTAFSVNTDEILHIAPVRALTKLVYLDLRGTYPNKGKLSDLSPLGGMSIRRLDCSSTQIADLSPLAGLPLTYLHFNHNPVSDLAPLKGMPLEELGLAETKVADLSPLKGMKIKVLGAQLLPVTDLSPLAGMPLTGLDLYHTVGVTSLEPLRGMPLEGLNLQDVPVSDLSPLAGMTTLRTLLLQGNQVSDLSPLAGLKLTDLIMFDEQITDLTPLKGLPLSRLIIHGTGVTDLRPLQGMPLVEIRLNPKNITEGLDILRELKSLQAIGIDGTTSWPPAEFWERYDKGEFTR